jgi:GT2 family glycosyltransferase
VKTIPWNPHGAARVTIRGRFLFLGDEKFWVRGVTYGTFRPDAAGREYPTGPRLERDFAAIAANGFNTIRTYTVPPRDVLDTASRHGLRCLIGIPWEQHVAFLDDPERAASIVARVRAGVRACAGHTAVLAYAVGNEIPAPIVRWHGREAIERFLATLVDVVRAEDPDALATYVNYPTTEYLELPFVDLVCFNVYLEDEPRLDAYLSRLHNLAGDRPLLLTEVGLDSRRHGEAGQARSLEWQLRTVFRSGASGAFVFAWTDEWHRGGFDVDDWDFGITDRERHPKPALAAVRQVMAEAPFRDDGEWPHVSVVVCSYNGSRTIRDTLEGLRRLAYPNYEVIVVDDGSTDATPSIVSEYPFRLVSTPNHGLSAARNLGLSQAKGEIVAYIDDDAWPDPHWLHYLVTALTTGGHAGVGGPNLPPPDDGWIAECVAHAPGGPTHVLLTDRVAEHVPGCNMAFRRSALEAIGGFDVRFRTAGDDVDVCWRLRDRGWTLGFSAAAVVWHHRRNSMRTYWRQQVGYGAAEALLERKWPERYNAAGHASWAGRLYNPGVSIAARLRSRIYQGTWGLAPFQSLYEAPTGTLAALTVMPEWYLLVGVLALLAAIGTLWVPLAAFAVPLFVVAVAAPIARSVTIARRAQLRERADAPSVGRRRVVLAAMHVVQPVARLAGRVRHGLTLWRWRGPRTTVVPFMHEPTMWTEKWQEPSTMRGRIEAALRTAGFSVARGGAWDNWDLEVRGGLLGRARLLAVVEEHGHGRQLWRFRISPRYSALAAAIPAVLAVLAAGAMSQGASVAAALLGAAAVAAIVRSALECGRSVGAFLLGRYLVARDLSTVFAHRAGVVPHAPPLSLPRGRSARRLFDVSA